MEFDKGHREQESFHTTEPGGRERSEEWSRGGKCGHNSLTWAEFQCSRRFQSGSSIDDIQNGALRRRPETFNRRTEECTRQVVKLICTTSYTFYTFLKEIHVISKTKILSPHPRKKKKNQVPHPYGFSPDPRLSERCSPMPPRP